jgi:hypothetical protein
VGGREASEGSPYGHRGTGIPSGSEFHLALHDSALKSRTKRNTYKYSVSSYTRLFWKDLSIEVVSLPVTYVMT